MLVARIAIAGFSRTGTTAFTAKHAPGADGPSIEVVAKEFIERKLNAAMCEIGRWRRPVFAGGGVSSRA